MSYNVIITDSGFPDNIPEREILETINCSVTNIQCKEEVQLRSLVSKAETSEEIKMYNFLLKNSPIGRHRKYLR